MPDTLRGVIVGCGYFGRIQLEAWSRIPEAEIVAACDFDLERARAAAPHAYTDAARMLDEVRPDFLDIATRPDSHLPLVRLAAERGIAVICQKPMAPDWAQAVEMVRTAEQAGVPLMIHENWRWQPWYRQARRLLDEGAIGRPLLYRLEMRQGDGLGPNPYPKQPYFAQMPRLIIYEAIVHPIDTARFLFGEIEGVFARARRANPIIAGEDGALLILSHAGGLHGSVEGNRYVDPVPPGPAMGWAQIDGEGASIRISPTGDVYVGERLAWRNTVTEGYRGDCVRATQQHFIDCLRGAKPFETGGREYLKTFAAVEAAYASLERDCLVDPRELAA